MWHQSGSLLSQPRKKYSSRVVRQLTRGLVASSLCAALLGCSDQHFDSAVDLSELASDPDQTAIPASAPQTSAPSVTDDSSPKLTAKPAAMPMKPMPQSSEITFKDQVQSNVSAPEGLDGLVFLDTAGKRVSLQSYLGKKNVVLVFTEGFAGGMLCPFCKTQTSRLVANYDKFAQLETEILVVYPGSREHLDEFVAAAKKTEKEEVDNVPFPLVLDEDLVAVSYFNIASNLAHPSTFIIDKKGNVRLAYVGADMTADRPSVSAMLKILNSANEN